MADDDKGAKPGTPLSVEHPATIGMDKAESSKPGVQKVDDPTHTEWTASDRRGPLNEADDQDVERVVPAHETDAEGVVDPASHASVPVDPQTRQPIKQEDDGLHEPDSSLVSDEPAGAAATSHLDEPDPAPVDEPARQRSLMPIAAGLVIGALIGAGSAWLVYSQADDGADDPQVAALASRVDALDKRPDPQPEIAKLEAGLADVRGRVAALSKPSGGGPAPKSGQPAVTPSADAGLAGEVAALQMEFAELKTRMSAPGQGKAATAKSGGSASSPGASAADSGLAGKVAALQGALDELKTRTASLQAEDAKEKGAADKVATLQSSLADAEKRAASAQSSLESVKSEQKQLGDKVAGLTIAVAGALKKADGAQKEASGATSGVQSVQTQQKALEGKLGSPALAVVADSLVQQIDAGQPFTRQVDALAALSADPAKIAVLRENAAHGVPSAQALLTKWKPLEDPVIATGETAPADANFGERLKHGLFGLVSVRRADTTTGNDLSSRVNLIAADLAHDDVPGAYAIWQALPAGAKAKSTSWGALAKTSVEALSAARDLQHIAIDALGAKNSDAKNSEAKNSDAKN